MIPALLSPLLQIDLPAPPVPGGEVVTEWWRVIALIAVTVLTTGILALIFRPALPVPVTELVGDSPAPQLHPVPANVAPLRRVTDVEPPTGIISFPGVERSSLERQDSQTAQAAAERLRRITQQPKDEQATESTNGKIHADTRASNVESGDADSGKEGEQQAEKYKASTEQIDRVHAAMIGREEGEMTNTSESWELPGEIPETQTTSADTLPPVPPDYLSPDDLDLLGDIVNRSPSEMDRLISETVVEDATDAGTAASADDIERLLGRPTSGKIVQFVPRANQPTEIDPAYELLNDVQPQTDTVITQFPVDLVTREQVTSTVQELLFCANVGEFIHGFALYTDKFLFTFMDQSGLNEDEFRERFSSIPPRDPSDWIRADSIREFRRLDDGRIAATVEYRHGGKINGRERYIFKIDTQTERWLIDDISSAT